MRSFSSIAARRIRSASHYISSSPFPLKSQPACPGEILHLKCRRLARRIVRLKSRRLARRIVRLPTTSAARPSPSNPAGSPGGSFTSNPAGLPRRVVHTSNRFGLPGGPFSFPLHHRLALPPSNPPACPANPSPQIPPACPADRSTSHYISGSPFPPPRIPPACPARSFRLPTTSAARPSPSNPAACPANRSTQIRPACPAKILRLPTTSPACPSPQNPSRLARRSFNFPLHQRLALPLKSRRLARRRSFNFHYISRRPLPPGSFIPQTLPGSHLPLRTELDPGIKN